MCVCIRGGRISVWQLVLRVLNYLRYGVEMICAGTLLVLSRLWVVRVTGILELAVTMTVRGALVSVLCRTHVFCVIFRWLMLLRAGRPR